MFGFLFIFTPVGRKKFDEPCLTLPWSIFCVFLSPTGSPSFYSKRRNLCPTFQIALSQSFRIQTETQKKSIFDKFSCNADLSAEPWTRAWLDSTCLVCTILLHLRVFFLLIFSIFGGNKTKRCLEPFQSCCMLLTQHTIHKYTNKYYLLYTYVHIRETCLILNKPTQVTWVAFN